MDGQRFTAINNIDVGLPSAGSSTTPIYINSSGVPTACSYSLGAAASKSVTTSVTSGSSALVTSGAVYTAINNAKPTEYYLKISSKKTALTTSQTGVGSCQMYFKMSWSYGSESGMQGYSESVSPYPVTVTCTSATRTSVSEYKSSNSDKEWAFDSAYYGRGKAALLEYFQKADVIDTNYPGTVKVTLAVMGYMNSGGHVLIPEPDNGYVGYYSYDLNINDSYPCVTIEISNGSVTSADIAGYFSGVFNPLSAKSGDLRGNSSSQVMIIPHRIVSVVPVSTL